MDPRKASASPLVNKVRNTIQRDFEGFEADPVPADPLPVVEGVVALGKSMGLEVSDGDVEELVDDHREELTTDELQELQLEQHQITAKELASEEEEEGVDEVPSSVIKDMCGMWNELQSFVEKYHPDQAETSRICNTYNDSVVSHFREILKKRQKKTSLDRYFVRQGSSESQVVPSGIKRRRKVTPDKDLLPKVLMEGDSPSKQ